MNAQVSLLGLYQPGEGWLFRAGVGWKYLIMLALSIPALVLQQWPLTVSSLMATVLLLFSSGIGLVRALRIGWVMWLLLAALTAYHLVVLNPGAAVVQPGNLLLAILIIKWVGYTRLARSVVMQEKAKDYLMVSTISGASTFSIMRRHLLPHIVGPVMALATVDIGKVILLVASLSYLGLGVQLPSAEWGAMLNEAQMFFTQAPHLMVAPGLAIFLVVCAANWLGDQLQILYAISGERKEETGVAA